MKDIRTRATGFALATALGLGGVTTGLVIAPAVASAATDETTTTSEAVGDRLSRIKDALSGLVSDGSITQEQADEVATTLDEALPQRGPGGPGGMGHGGPGGHHGGRHLALDTAASTLGVTEDELRTALGSGQSLADVAESEGVSKDALITALVDEAKAHLAEEVTEGDLTQEQADARAAELTERVTAMVEREGLGRGGHGAPPAAPEAEDEAPAPSPTA
jgi:polyhydroxyalkanoate synthesis regulator phasin